MNKCRAKVEGSGVSLLGMDLEDEEGNREGPAATSAL